MSSHTYRVVCPCRALGAEPRALNAVLTDVSLLQVQPDLLGTWYERRRDDERLTFFVAASDLTDALATVRRVAAELVRLVDERLGEGVLQLSETELASRTEVLESGVLGSDLDGVADRIEAGYAASIERPHAQLVRKVRCALGSDLPRGESLRVRFGRVWTPCEPRPEGTPPWRMRPGREVGLPRTSELATLAGARYDVTREGIAERTALLQDRCVGTGWSAVYLTGALEEWLGRRGFFITRRHGDHEASLAFLPVADPFDLLWFQGTSGSRVGLGTEELVGRLRAWRPRCEMTPVSVSECAVTLYFRTVPQDLAAFAAEIIALCPNAAAADQDGRPILVDASEEGRSSFRALGAAIGESHCLRLRWD